ncbi:MAG: hypothetical protein LBH66_09070 [Oscillospiraceae bacterium]|nr:hypothetical protein [Oscillospiraceae bacterium]
MMNKEMFEKIEYLRANANIGYEEASALLERYDGDLTRAMIDLERANRLYTNRAHGVNPWDDAFTRGKDEYRKHHARCKGGDPDAWYRKLLRAKLQITRDGEVAAEVPLLVPVATAIFAPYLTIAGAVVGCLAGYRVRDPRKPSKDGGEA